MSRISQGNSIVNAVFLGLKDDSEAPTREKIGEHDGPAVAVVDVAVTVVVWLDISNGMG